MTGDHEIFTWMDPAQLHWLWALAGVGTLLWLAARLRRRALLLLFPRGREAVNQHLADAPPLRRRRKSLLLLAGLACLVVGLARPAWNPQLEKVQVEGRQVMFVLDVSRSMLAEDLRPNRLERAKLMIRDALDRLAGDRVGLVVFAGTAVVRCPPTLDDGFLRMVLDSVDPSSLSRGGTLIGDALRKALDEGFDPTAEGHRDVILITDGEDHESEPLRAAEELGAAGIRLIAIGLGSGEEGQAIPATGEDGGRDWVRDAQGRIVKSRLDAATLRRMTAVTPGGRYINLATGSMDFGGIYARLMAGQERATFEGRQKRRWQEGFQVFLGLAWLLLMLEWILHDRGRPREPDQPVEGAPGYAE